jgi:isochorismate hydrolase
MEALVAYPRSSAQQELVREYCRSAEEQIMAAGSPQEAAAIKDEWCNRFRRECESHLLIHATASYLDAVIKQRWKYDEADRTDYLD